MRFYAHVKSRVANPGTREEVLAELQGDCEALYEGLRKYGVVALHWPWVLLIIHHWRLAVSNPFCTAADRREARRRLGGIGGALAGRGRGRTETAETARARAFVRKYLPMLRQHLKNLPRVGVLKLSSLSDGALARCAQLLRAGFSIDDLTKRLPRVDAYAVMAERLGCDERHVRRLARRSQASRGDTN